MKRFMLVVAVVAWGAMASAASLCNGSSAGVKIDTTSGTRTAAASETIRYGATWETATSGATAVVAVNGTTLKSATGTGSVVWTPTRNGTYTLTHKVMVNGELVGEVLTATFVVDGLNPENPVITPVSGTEFDSSLTVSMSCPSEGATIHYTVDGSEPTMESPIYKRFRVSGKTTVKARAFWENGEGSEVVTAEYALGQCEDPVISLRDGAVFLHSNQQVSIRSGEEGTLRYTLDGSEPTAESPVYSGPFTISESTVVKAKVFSDRFFDSKVVSANLTRQWEVVATPVITAVESFQGSKTKVVIDCATPGALIRYTTNGNDPNSHSTKYKGPIYVTDSCTVKAYAVMDDYLNSGIASRTVTKVWGIGDTLGKPDHAFTTSGDAGFVRVDDTTATLGESMRSGAIVNSQTSILETVVVGPGLLSFKWKVSCEGDEELHAWDHAEFCVDGVEIARIDGITEWQAMNLRIEGDGEHVVVWRYVKDDVELDGEDCMWVSDYDWKSDYTATRTGTVSIPYAWMLSNCPDVVDEYASYEAVAKQLAANGHNTVEEAYIAGLNPADPSSELRATVNCEGGKVYVGWTPNLNTNGTTRIYKLFGRTSLVEGDWETLVQPWHRFFKVSVTMPTGAAGEASAIVDEGFVPEDDPGGVQLWENGPYWAECNVGATKPEEYGYYFWWGDTVGYKRNANDNGWVSVKDGTAFSFSSDNCPTYGKNNPQLQSAGYIDSTGNLVIAYDAATANLGAHWRMPTDAEFGALINNCDTMWTTRGGTCGWLVTGRGAYASRSIFLPAVGGGHDSGLYRASSYGGYWSSTPNSDDSCRAWYLAFDSRDFLSHSYYRCSGRTVRPLRGNAK